jgi:hypothetical protein
LKAGTKVEAFNFQVTIRLVQPECARRRARAARRNEARRHGATA